MTISFTTLGTASALPTVDRFPSAHVLNVHGRLFLIDCGEGCQMLLRRNGFSFLKIREIFISHMHGDHLYGIFGLLSTMSLLGRSADLFIYAPIGVEEILNNFICSFGDQFKYKIKFIPLHSQEKELLIDAKSYQIFSFPMNHRIDCYGLLLEEKIPKLNVCKESIDEYSLSLSEIAKLKNGEDVVRNESFRIDCSSCTYLPYKPRSFAYCGDTAPYSRELSFVNGVDLLYHEATFPDEFSEIAKSTMHTTARQAAELATEANVGKLVIGHFSSRLKQLDIYLKEARSVFKNTELAKEGKVFDIPKQSIVSDKL